MDYVSTLPAYRSSTFELGPNATEHEAARYLCAEARQQGHTPVESTVRVYEVMPPKTGVVVRYTNRKGVSEVVNVDPADVVGFAMRWRHSIHDEVLATRWTGYVRVHREPLVAMSRWSGPPRRTPPRPSGPGRGGASPRSECDGVFGVAGPGDAPVVIGDGPPTRNQRAVGRFEMEDVGVAAAASGAGPADDLHPVDAA